MKVLRLAAAWCPSAITEVVTATSSPRENTNPTAIVSVSGTIPETLEEDVAAGRRPRPDYVVIAERMGAQIIDFTAATSDLGRLGSLVAGRAGNNIALAMALFRRARHADVIFTDGEQVGLPYAAMSRVLRKRPAHHMIVHIMSVAKKERVFRGLRLRDLIDTYFVYSKRQAEVIEDFGVPADNVVLTSFMVDTKFFDPANEDQTPRPMICSAGLEFRDYETLIEAVRGLDIDVVIAAASPWSKRPNTIGDTPLPDNVTMCRLSLHELRGLYAEAALVVMPLVEVDFQAGVTTILEAMSMAKAVVCSKTRGQTDVIIDGETGVYVPPGDANALREAIVQLLDNPDQAAKIGAAARSWVVDNADVERYADRLVAAMNRD